VIHPETFDFLKQLALHNNKPWFDEHRNIYLAARENFEQFVEILIQKLVIIDKSITGTTAKKAMFRIHRDVRFSKNKTPYKINMSASFSRGGKKSVFADYYVHLQPGNSSYAGGGVWMPEGDVVKNIRQEIDYNFSEWQKIINAASFRKAFGTLEHSEGQTLLQMPRGYEKDNPAAEFLKLKSWVATHNISDEDLMKRGSATRVAKVFENLQPMILFLNRALE
jgi:uncharacterized protein (TIGR02453 family)